MKMIEKGVISARVPIEFKNDFSNWCKANNTTVSEHIQRVFAHVDRKTYLPKADSVEVEPDTRTTLISLGGGSMIAYFVYKAIVTMLVDKYPMMAEDNIRLYAMSGAVTVGLLGGLGINKLMRMLSQ